MGEPKSDRCGAQLPLRPGVEATARWQGHAEQLEKPSSVPARRNRRSRVDRITGSTGKSIEGERVTDGFGAVQR